MTMTILDSLERLLSDMAQPGTETFGNEQVEKYTQAHTHLLE